MDHHAEREPGLDFSRPGESFVNTVRRVLAEPTEFFEQVTGEARVWPPLIFALVCVMASAVLGIAVEFFVPLDFGPFGGPWNGVLGDSSVEYGGAAAAVFALVLVLAPLLIVLGLYVGAAICHLLVRLIVGSENNGYWATFKINAYSLGAVGLFSWIPVVGLLASLYGFYLIFVGARETHYAPNGRAAVVAIVLFLIFGSNLLLPAG